MAVRRFEFLPAKGCTPVLRVSSCITSRSIVKSPTFILRHLIWSSRSSPDLDVNTACLGTKRHSLHHDRSCPPVSRKSVSKPSPRNSRNIGSVLRFVENDRLILEFSTVASIADSNP